MDVGKVLTILGGIITLVGTFFFTWILVGGEYYNGLNLFLNIADVFSNTSTYVTATGLQPIILYIAVVIMILIAISGILLLIGVKSRVLSIIASLFPLGLGVFVLLFSLGIMPERFFNNIYPFASADQLVAGILPYHMNLGPVAIGTYVLLVGGVFGFISGFFTREAYY